MLSNKVSPDIIDLGKLIGRGLFGFLFLLNGLKKFGYFGGNVNSVTSLFGVAGVIEIIGGTLIVFGLFTQVTAAVTSIQMAVAWFYMHVPEGWNPLLNNGQAALLFFGGFIILTVIDPGRFSIDEKIAQRES